MSLLIHQLRKGKELNKEDRDAVRAILQQGLADPDPQVREPVTMLLENSQYYKYTGNMCAGGIKENEILL